MKSTPHTYAVNSLLQLRDCASFTFAVGTKILCMCYPISWYPMACQRKTDSLFPCK